MKSTPLIINWHESNAPIYSADFQKGEKGRLATGGGDNNVRVRRSGWGLMDYADSHNSFGDWILMEKIGKSITLRP
jgi:hypothetical protein